MKNQEDEDSQVRDLLAQLSDEAALSVAAPPSHSFASSSSLLRLSSSHGSAPSHTDPQINTEDAALFARFQRLKAPPPTPRHRNPSSDAASASAVLHHDPLIADLASRLAALKSPSSSSSSYAAATPAQLPSSATDDVENLLASIADSVRLHKQTASRLNPSLRLPHHDDVSDDDEAEDTISESEVDLIVNWAKEAARLDDVEADAEAEVSTKNKG